MQPLAIPDALLASIYAHAIACFPDECCGYLVGSDGAIDEVVRCRNAQADGANPVAPDRGADRGFAIDGPELFAFFRTFRTERPARIVYHSHTNGSAYFSDVDRIAERQTRYEVQHLVVGVLATGVTEAALFAWSDDAATHVELARWSVA